MKKLFILFFLSTVLCSQTVVTPGVTTSNNNAFTGSNTFKSINNVLFADQYTGADIGTQINNCLLALPATGGTCDGRGFSGTFTNATNPVAGLGNKPWYLMLGALTINDSSCWTFSNDGASPPAQGLRKISGVGYDAASISAGKTPVSGTIINNSCNTGAAKFDTRGAGVLEVSGITFQDSTGDALPFWQTTNTILLFHDNQCYGSKNGILNNQDCVILGSTTTTVDGSATAAFQGYGTHVENNYFNHIRRAVYGQTFANNVWVQRNTVWVQSGSNLAGGAAIEFAAIGGQTNTGNTVKDNLLEITNYPYGIKFSLNGFNNTIAGNGCYDPTGTHLACSRFEGTSQYNLVEDGYRNDSFPGISEDSGSLGTNTFVTSHQNQFSSFTGPVRFINSGSGSPIASLRQEIGVVNSPLYNARITTTNDEFYWGISTAGNTAYGLWTYPAGGTAEQLIQFRRYDANQRGIYINAPTTGFFECAADCRFRAAAATNAWLGTNTTPDVILIGDALLKFNSAVTFKTDNTLDLGQSGALRPRTIYAGTSVVTPTLALSANISWTSGAGVPSAGSCLAANGGSLYSRTDGTTTTTLYVCDNSTHVWTAK